jgi:N-acetylmuramoyl-L-alanine amidase-like protein
MAWMPGVDTSRIANDGNSGLSCSPDILCFHTIVGYAPALAAHFSVRADGYIWQHRDTSRQSAANYQGNGHIIAVETEDHGAAFGSWSGSNVPPWTSQQIDALSKIAVWANQVHGIPLVQCPNSIRGSKGIAYHRQGIDGNFSNGRVPGGEVWSTSRGKVCPGDNRIAQMPQIISLAQSGGVDLTPEEHNALMGVSNVLGAYYTASKGKMIGKGIWEMEQVLGAAYAETGKAIGKVAADTEKAVNALSVRLANIEAQLSNVSTPEIDEVALAQALVANGLDGVSAEEIKTAVTAALKEQWAK